MPGTGEGSGSPQKKLQNKRLGILTVVVTAGTTPYLLQSLTALAQQSYSPGVVLIVDVASRENGLGTGTPVEETAAQAGLTDLCAVRVVRAPQAANFGDAVKQGLELYEKLTAAGNRRRPGGQSPLKSAQSEATWTGPTGALSPISTAEIQTVASASSTSTESTNQNWLWLLHDDSAPAPNCLEELVTAVASARSVALAGPKQVDWDNPRHLLEVGNRTTASARRANDIADGELDQGQYDMRSDVLAVGTAGTFIKFDVWKAVGGIPSVFGPFGDGLALSRAVRINGRRVIVVPSAIIRHRQASYLGLRSKPVPALSSAASVSDTPVKADCNVSFKARRIAQLRNWAIFSSTAIMPLLGFYLLLLGFARAVWRLLSGELQLARAEIQATATVIFTPQILFAQRRQLAKISVSSRSVFADLYLHPRDIRAAKRDRRRQERERRAREFAPSELELAEKAVLTRRRRVGLTVVLLAAVVLSMVGLRQVLLTGHIAGGALPSIDFSWQDAWQQARATWLASADGYASSPTPLLLVLTVLLLPAGLVGASSAQTIHFLVLLAPLLSGLAAWFATGVVTRRVMLRTWGAIFWVAAPSFLFALGQGRLAAVAVHILLPLALLSLAKTLGVDRRDAVTSGMVDAKHLTEQEFAALSQGANVKLTELGQLLKADASGEAKLAQTGPITDVIPAQQIATPRTVAAEYFGSGSITAAGLGGLVTFALVALAPALAPLLLLFLLLAVLLQPRRAARLLIMALPLLAAGLPAYWQASHQPSLASAVQLLLTDPGQPLAVKTPTAYDLLAGIPLNLSDVNLASATSVFIKIAGVALLVLALISATLPGKSGNGARLGILGGLGGLSLAVLSTHTVTAIGTDLAGTAAAVTGWAGVGLSVALAGLLTAVLSGGDKLYKTIAQHAFGWRHILLAFLSALVLLLPLSCAGGWGWLAHTHTAPAMSLQTATQQVPLIAAETQNSATRGRVLYIDASANGLTVSLWRHSGVSVVDTLPATLHDQYTNSIDTATLPIFLLHEDATARWQSATLNYTDTADKQLLEAVALTLAGNEADASDQLAAHDISVVLVKDHSGDEATAATVAALDATAGLDRLAHTATGTSWRVTTANGAEPARAVLVQGDTSTSVSADALSVDTTIPESTDGATRTLTLAERADSGWKATLNGAPLSSSTAEHSWQQTFVLPPSGGHLVVQHTSQIATVMNWFILLSLLLAGLAALPLRRRSRR